MSIPTEFSYRPDAPFTPLETLADQLCRATWTIEQKDAVPGDHRPPDQDINTMFNDDPNFYDAWTRCARFVLAREKELRDELGLMQEKYDELLSQAGID